jgi:hypothetical protein
VGARPLHRQASLVAFVELQMTARFSLMVLVGVCFAIPGRVFGCGGDAASEGGLDMSENALSGEYFQEGSDGLSSMETEHNDGVTSANGHS